MIKIIFTIFVLTLAATFDLSAGVFSSTGKLISRKITKEIIDESAEKTIKLAAKKIGRESAEKIYKKFGVKTLEFVAEHGDEGARFVTKFGNNGVRIAIREGSEKIIKLADKYGYDVIKIAEKHPGTGTLIVEKLGKDGIIIAKNCSTDTVNKTLRYLPEMTKKGVRKKYVNAVVTQGGTFFKKASSVVIKNPLKTIGAGAGIYYLLAPEDFKEKIEKATVYSSDLAGKVIGKSAKTIGRTTKNVMTEIAPSWVWILMLFGACFILICWFYKKINILFKKIINLFSYLRNKLNR